MLWPQQHKCFKFGPFCAWESVLDLYNQNDSAIMVGPTCICFATYFTAPRVPLDLLSAGASM